MMGFVTVVMLLMNISQVPVVLTHVKNLVQQPRKKPKEGIVVFVICRMSLECLLYSIYFYRYELESQGYAIKLEYINKGRQAKLSQQERNMALKAEQVEAEALRAEKEREKHEAEEPERQALDKYRQIEQEAVKEKEEIERSKQETEASKVMPYHIYILVYLI